MLRTLLPSSFATALVVLAAQENPFDTDRIDSALGTDAWGEAKGDRVQARFPHGSARSSSLPSTCPGRRSAGPTRSGRLAA